jgi:signal peptidase I
MCFLYDTLRKSSVRQRFFAHYDTHRRNLVASPRISEASIRIATLASRDREKTMSVTSAVSPARISPNPSAPPSGAQVHTNTIGSKIRAQGSASVRILNGDMFPWMRSGDQVFVRRWNFDLLRAGDVILFERNEDFFVHRVLSVEGSGATRRLITKGDALDSADSPVTAEEFVGRATRIHRGKRHIDIQSLGQRIAARVIARLSLLSRLWHAPLRSVRRLFA